MVKLRNMASGDKAKSKARKIPTVIDFRQSKKALRKIGEAVERHPARAADVLRAWIKQRH
jgi:flagellar biosynthesis/type III secretory pathway M-ring protein FliF/YscJ